MPKKPSSSSLLLSSAQFFVQLIETILTVRNSYLLTLRRRFHIHSLSAKDFSRTRHHETGPTFPSPIPPPSRSPPSSQPPTTPPSAPPSLQHSARRLSALLKDPRPASSSRYGVVSSASSMPSCKARPEPCKPRVPEDSSRCRDNNSTQPRTPPWFRPPTRRTSCLPFYGRP